MNQCGHRNGTLAAASSAQVVVVEKAGGSKKEKKKILGASSMAKKKVGRGVSHCVPSDEGRSSILQILPHDTTEIR